MFRHDVTPRLQPGDRPLVLVFGALPGGLTHDPKLKILKAVIEAISVLVMDIFKFAQRSPQVLLHYVSMFKDWLAIDVQRSVAMAESWPGGRSAKLGSAGIGAGSRAALPNQSMGGFEPKWFAADRTVRLLLFLPTRLGTEFCVAGRSFKLLAASLARVLLCWFGSAQLLHPFASAYPRAAAPAVSLRARDIERFGADRTDLLRARMSGHAGIGAPLHVVALARAGEVFGIAGRELSRAYNAFHGFFLVTTGLFQSLLTRHAIVNINDKSLILET